MSSSTAPAPPPPQQTMSSAGSGLQADVPDSPVGFLCRDVPLWVSNPPIESVVFAWGASEDHQLGLDTEQDIYSPKVVESLLGLRFMGRCFGSCPLVGGSRNTLAIDADGGLWSWGWNDRGTLGHGHRALQRKPAPVEGLSGAEIVQAAIGGWHCLALDADGQAYCWGGNEYQQCGFVAPEDDDAYDQQAAAAGGGSLTPANGQQQQGADGGEDGSGSSSKARRWQRSSSGAGGSGSSSSGGGAHGVLPTARDILVPRRCMPGLVVKQVACGGMNSVVLTDTGEVWTWGEPWGDFAMDIQRAPKKVPGAVNIAAIACGAFHNLALVADGSVLSWGTNDYGQLGNGSTIYSMTPVEVCDLEEVAVADIAAGGWHSMALTADGQIYVWGRGEYGRLGIGDRTGSSKLRPHKVRGLEEHVVVQVAAGGTHSLCVTSSGRMFIWGRASYGRLGLGPDARDMYGPVEVQLPGGHQRWKIAAATAGGRHTMCLAVPVRDGGLKGSSVYGGNSEGVPSRAASVIGEPAPGNNNNGGGSNNNNNAGGSGGGGGRGAASNGAAAGGEGQTNQQQQQRVYDPFATQQQQQQPYSSSGRSNTPTAAGAAGAAAGSEGKAGRSGSNAAAGGPAAAGGSNGSSSRGLSAVGVSSPYQPGAPLPHGPTLSMQSSYSLVTSPGSSILGGGSPAAATTTAVGAAPAVELGAGGVSSSAGASVWGSQRNAAKAATAAPGAGAGAAAASAAADGANSPTRSPRGGHSSISISAAAEGGAGAAAAPNASPRGPTSWPAGAAGNSSVGGGDSSGHHQHQHNDQPQPLGVEAVHAATEAAVVQQLRLHGLLPPNSTSTTSAGAAGGAGSSGGGGGVSSGSGGLQAMLHSHGPLAAAAAAAGAGGGGAGGLRAGQGLSVSPRGIPPPMSPSQRAVGVDLGSGLREYVSTGDAYDVGGRGDSIQWQHQDVALALQNTELLIEDDALQEEIQEEQQREADEAALEEAEERQEEEVRLRRQEHQQRLREAQLRQQQQQQHQNPTQPGGGVAPGSGSQHSGSLSAALGVFVGSSGSNSGRPGSSQGRSGGFAAVAGGSSGSMRRSRSQQQLSDALAAVAAASNQSPRGESGVTHHYTLQRYASSPQQQTAGSSASTTQQQLQLGDGVGGSSGSRAPSGPINMPSFSAGVAGGGTTGGGGVRRMTSGGIMTSGPFRPGVGRVDSDVSQEGLVGLEGGSPNDSPRQAHGHDRAARGGAGGAGAADGNGGGNGRGHGRSRVESRGSASSISGESSSGQVELGASPPSGRYDVGLGERYMSPGDSLQPGREQLYLNTHLS